MTESGSPQVEHRGSERPGSEHPEPAESERTTPPPEPTFLETMKWAGVMLGITLLIAAITIPVLLWFE